MHKNILLNVSSLHGCHHQGAIIVVKIVLPVWYRGWTIADHLVKIAVSLFTTYMELSYLLYYVSILTFCGWFLQCFDLNSDTCAST